jgi:DNA topoisomerase-1
MPILRIGTTQFSYVHTKNNKQIVVKDNATLSRIKSLHIPPAYTDVVIATNKDDKVQAHGYDSKGRKQFIYAKWFVEQQDAMKFKKIMQLSKPMKRITTHVNKELSKYNANNAFDAHAFQICVILKLMMLCNFRIGNKHNVVKYKSYGLTTLEWHHVKFDESIKWVHISFIGKKGVLNESTCKDIKIYNFLFDALSKNKNKNKKIFTVSSNDVNEYLKQFGDISSKDIRTWQANVLFAKYFLENKSNADSVEKRQKYAIKLVAEDLHNTEAVCKKSYINPEFLKSA